MEDENSHFVKLYQERCERITDYMDTLPLPVNVTHVDTIFYFDDGTGIWSTTRPKLNPPSRWRSARSRIRKAWRVLVSVPD